jgi:hypothetical protein
MKAVESITAYPPSRRRRGVWAARAAAALVLACGATIAQAQWIVSGPFTPTGYNSSVLSGGFGPQQVGGAIEGFSYKATLWSGPTSWVSLHPAGSDQSFINAADALGQYGYFTVGTWPHLSPSAARWSGSAASMVNLNPAAALESIAFAADNGVIAGVARFATGVNAIVWLPDDSAINLHPTGAAFSRAYGVHGGQVCGDARLDSVTQASIWTSNTPVSWLSLHPAAAENSTAVGVHAGQQVGNVSFGYSDTRASLWSGTAASWVDLNPVGSTQSYATAVHAGMQVGFAYFGQGAHACLWRGSAASLVDLHQFLGPQWSSSAARAIWSDSTAVYIAGEGGYQDSTGVLRSGGILWKLPLVTYEAETIAAINLVGSLSSEEVTTRGNQTALGNFLRQALEAMQASNTAETLAKLDQAIGRTDGCALRGSPDGDGPGRDWITDCTAQAPIYDLLTTVRNALAP